MKKLLFFLVLPFAAMQAQDLHHQALSAQGNSTVLENGMYISQTVGQQSVIGNYTINGTTYGQGFQQSLWQEYISSTASNEITTIAFPNPFTTTINFRFSESLLGVVSVLVFDVSGKLHFSGEKTPVDNLISLDLPQLASGNYLVQLTAPNFLYYTQILKQE